MNKFMKNPSFKYYCFALVILMLFFVVYLVSERVVNYAKGETIAYGSKICYNEFRFHTPASIGIYLVYVEGAGQLYSSLDNFVKQKKYLCIDDAGSSSASYCEVVPASMAKIDGPKINIPIEVTNTTITTINSGLGESLKGKDVTTWIKVEVGGEYFWVLKSSLLKLLMNKSGCENCPVNKLVDFHESCVDFSQPLKSRL